jgi:hypothetical protein
LRQIATKTEGGGHDAVFDFMVRLVCVRMVEPIGPRSVHPPPPPSVTYREYNGGEEVVVFGRRGGSEPGFGAYGGLTGPAENSARNARWAAMSPQERVMAMGLDPFASIEGSARFEEIASRVVQSPSLDQLGVQNVKIEKYVFDSKIKPQHDGSMEKKSYFHGLYLMNFNSFSNLVEDALNNVVGSSLDPMVEGRIRVTALLPYEVGYHVDKNGNNLGPTNVMTIFLDARGSGDYEVRTAFPGS